MPCLHRSGLTFFVLLLTMRIKLPLFVFIVALFGNPHVTLHLWPALKYFSAQVCSCFDNVYREVSKLSIKMRKQKLCLMCEWTCEEEEACARRNEIL